MPPEPSPSIAETVAETALAASASATSNISQLTSSSADADEGRYLPGTLLGGRYRILGLLGRGGMGEVYRAMDLALGQAVALKFLPAEAAGNPRLLERFHGEVRVARLVSHPNVCRVFDIGEVEGTPFISMEYVDGEDLASLLTRIGRLPGDKALQAARQLCAGLAAAHDRGVIHRDLKPQNIMMNKRGDVVIMDFGLAAIADQLSGAEVRNGTPAYMAPEQLRGAAVTPASDVYALGLVLYELFTGKRPFEAKSLQQLIDLQESRHLTSVTSLAADVDPDVDKVIRRCLDPDPLKRPPGPLGVAAALPGGDPLAAALAAGETPSPELVANAGKVEGLALRYSIPCLAVIVASLIATPVFLARHRVQMMDPLANSPEVLAHMGRDIAASFGYAERPADTAVWVENRGEMVTWLSKLPGPKQWASWIAFEGPMRAIYREAAAPMIARPEGHLDRESPPLVAPGMVQVSLDSHGRLLSFRGIPRDLAASGTPDDVFRAARLNFAEFHEVPPAFVPEHASDTLRAWAGPHPGIPGVSLTVRMAAWRGQITQADVVYPYMNAAGSAPAQPASALSNARETFVFLLPIVGAFFAAFVARHNWKLGRTDRQGALRVAVARFLLGLVAWTGVMHPVPTRDLMDVFLTAAAGLLMTSGMIWLVYLAIEPAVRARYPHAMITWNRLLAGRWFDPQVCSHILIGGAIGCAIWIGGSLLEPSGQVSSGGNIWVILGTRQWIARHALVGSSALTWGLLFFAMICFLRGLVRFDILAALAAGVIFTMTEADVVRSSNWQAAAVIFIGVYGVLAFVLIRFGLVASIATIFFLNCFPDIWLGSDWTAWYAPIGIATILLMLTISLVAFWKSLGNRDLLGDPT